MPCTLPPRSRGIHHPLLPLPPGSRVPSERLRYLDRHRPLSYDVRHGDEPAAHVEAERERVRAVTREEHDS